ncbi:MAG: galactokinase [Phycisphaeraceae bacterium]
MSDVTTETGWEEAMQQAVALFAEQFERPPTIAVRAPGRINIIGEHTDYNDGFVLPMAIDRWTVMVGRENRSPRCRVTAHEVEGEIASFLNDDRLTPGRTQWANYVKGVMAQFNAAGHRLPSFDAAVASTVPLGAGLSSSAALEVATATFLELLLGIRLDPLRKTRWCQRAEHDFAGVPCGIMDQMTSIVGRRGHAVLIDCRSMEWRPVALDEQKLALVVADTNVKHDLASSEYATRRQECQQVVDYARAHGHSDARALRDLTMMDLEEMRKELDPTLYRRARHVVAENQRTLLAAEAFEQGEMDTVGRLMNESHTSLRDDYQVSCDELDTMAELAREVDGVYGSRLTGGGFGGSTITLVHPDAVGRLIEHLQQRYPEATGRETTVFRVRPAEGATPMAT